MTPMLAGQDNELDRAVVRRIAPQLFDRLMSDAEVECRHIIVARVVHNEWPLAMVNEPNASVRFENIQGLLPRVLTAPQGGPDLYVRHEMACGIAAGELPDVFENEDKSMQDLACAGTAAALSVHEGALHE
ncbi:hypothetical protein [Bradyrhizobium sp. CCBAU 51753]|uniref:hypothetical protein n=1 Tax=Bradyrhizobium sp. CCBAU 51753 TaxID=1325100 RepID=UPI00188D5338|nr:hypothetical protein [Bradyrhizobium sp. CCBAU 51753]QOZ23693.1 hypothetical protein XH93_08590 [Bradyrhizobium sp. CCBAU 51753]